VTLAQLAQIDAALGADEARGELLARHFEREHAHAEARLVIACP
jgi:hypothetical protein